MELWAGAPAKLLRVMSAEERTRFDRNAAVYRDLARRFRTGLRSVG
jgi:carbonic anhydrase/acetyltransferase-like protein (isoleucine patch superfamily)